MAIETLILTGANNHDWQRSAPFCRDLLQASGRFEATLTETPDAVLASLDDPAGIDLFFLDYNGPDWSDAARRNFTAAVKAGTGLCVLHAADNGFRGWKEFEEMCALLWRDGTGHGKYHPFDIRITQPEHPAVKGLPPVLKAHPDELYHKLVHLHDAPYETLATAYSSPESGGTGRDEPAVVARTYGAGRVFHCILGHVWKGGGMETFENPDFQRLLLNGCEWAATGRVANERKQ